MLQQQSFLVLIFLMFVEFFPWFWKKKIYEMIRTDEKRKKTWKSITSKCKVITKSSKTCLSALLILSIEYFRPFIAVSRIKLCHSNSKQSNLCILTSLLVALYWNLQTDYKFSFKWFFFFPNLLFTMFVSNIKPLWIKTITGRRNKI